MDLTDISTRQEMYQTEKLKNGAKVPPPQGNFP